MESVITLDPLIVTFIVGGLIPILTGVVTKLGSSTTVKAVTALVLSSVTAVLTQLFVDNASNTFEPKAAAMLLFTTFVANLGSYIGVWKPIGNTDQVPLQRVTANFGLG